MTSAPSPDDPLGYDVAVTDDIPEDGRSAGGDELLAWALAHRFQAATLPLVDAPGGEQEFGVVASTWIGEATTPELARRKSALATIVAQRDPRVEPTTVRAVVDLAGPELEGKYALTISITARATTGRPISLILGVSAVTVDLLSQGR